MLAHSFLIKSSSKLLVTRTGIKAWMSLISGLWFPWPIYMFFEMRFDLGTLDSGERLLPFGLLVYMNHLMTKPTKWHVRTAKTQIGLGIRPVWSESSLSAWIKLWSLATHWAHGEDSDQTGRILRLIWVFAGRTVILLVLSWCGSTLYYIRLLSLWYCQCYSTILTSFLCEVN